MRKLLTICIVFAGILFLSCQKEEVDVNSGIVVIPPSTGDKWSPKDMYNSSYNLDQLDGIPVNIRLCYDTPNSYVAVSSPSAKILSYDRDTEALRERFIVRKDVLTGRHNIYTIGEMSSHLIDQYFSCWEQYPKEKRYYPVVYHTTGWPTMGGKMYIELIPEIESCCLAIQPTKGSRAGETLYMTQSLTDKKRIELLPGKAITGNNIFSISPVEEFEIVEIQYELGEVENIELECIYTRDIININSSIPSKYSNAISATVIERSAFSNIITVSYSITNVFTVGVLCIDALGEMITSGSWVFSTGKEEAKPKIVTGEYSLDIPAYENAFLKIYMEKSHISADYVAKLEGKETGKITYAKGTWKGIQAGEIVYDLTRASGVPISVPNRYNLHTLKAEALAKSIPLIIK